VPHFVIEISRVGERLCELGAGDVPNAGRKWWIATFSAAFAETELRENIACGSSRLSTFTNSMAEIHWGIALAVVPEGACILQASIQGGAFALQLSPL